MVFQCPLLTTEPLSKRNDKSADESFQSPVIHEDRTDSEYLFNDISGHYTKIFEVKSIAEELAVAEEFEKDLLDKDEQVEYLPLKVIIGHYSQRLCCIETVKFIVWQGQKDGVRVT